MVWARYLKIILKDNDNTISTLNYLKQLSTPSNKERIEAIVAMSNIDCENDNFVKHYIHKKTNNKSKREEPRDQEARRPLDTIKKTSKPETKIKDELK